MPLIGGTKGIKEFKGEYSFAVDGGAISTITLRGDGGTIPAGSYVLGGFIEVDTAVTSGGAATLAVTVNAANDIVAATVVSGAPWSTTGLKSIIPAHTGATAIKCTADRNPAIVVGAVALTAGIFRVVLFYR